MVGTIVDDATLDMVDMVDDTTENTGDFSHAFLQP